MDFRKKRLTIEEAKKIDLTSYLSSLGHEPVKIRNVDYWYCSPLRKENTPSFKVNQKLNVCKRIDLHHLGIRKSELARKEIEELFGLVKAEGRKKKEELNLQPISMGKVNYGRIESKKALTNVLNKVLNEYKYSSLPELNAVLKQYNVMADRGSENSKIFLANGLVYRILDEQGKPIGVPIKASDFYFKPTLKFLEEKFKENEIRKIPDKLRVKNVIDKALLRSGNIHKRTGKVIEKRRHSHCLEEVPKDSFMVLPILTIQQKMFSTEAA